MKVKLEVELRIKAAKIESQNFNAYLVEVRTDRPRLFAEIVRERLGLPLYLIERTSDTVSFFHPDPDAVEKAFPAIKFIRR